MPGWCWRAESSNFVTAMRPIFAFLAVLLAGAVAVMASAPPQRVVSLAPNVTGMVLALGAGDRLVGVTSFCDAPAGVPRIRGGIEPEAEAILAASPDLVLATPMTPPGTRRQLADLGLRVEVLDARSLRGIEDSMTRLAGILGVGAPPAAGAEPREAKLTAALLFGADTGYSAGRGTHAHEILEVAGLRNIAADAGGPWPQLGEEFLLAADPDVLVVADFGNSSREQIMSALQAHRVRRHLRAVREGRVVVVPAPAFSVPGPEALAEAGRLRALLGTP